MIEGVIYGVDGESSELMAVSMENGKRLWTTTKPTLAPNSPKKSRHGSAFLVYHESNQQFWIFGEMGDLILAKLSPDGYRELGRQNILAPTNGAWGRKVVWSQPAFATKSIFARNDKEIIRIENSTSVELSPSIFTAIHEGNFDLAENIRNFFHPLEELRYEINPILSPLGAIEAQRVKQAAQTLSSRITHLKGCPIDQPRNFANFVTVE